MALDAVGSWRLTMGEVLAKVCLSPRPAEYRRQSRSSLGLHSPSSGWTPECSAQRKQLCYKEMGSKSRNCAATGMGKLLLTIGRANDQLTVQQPTSYVSIVPVVSGTSPGFSTMLALVLRLLRPALRLSMAILQPRVVLQAGLGLGLLITSASAQADILVESNFDSGPEGWEFECNGSCASTGGTWSGSLGNPGGCLRFMDPSSPTTFAKAPADYHGDWSTLDGNGILRFEHRVVSHASGCGHKGYSVILEGPGGKAQWAGAQTEHSGWQVVNVPIHSAAWNVQSGTWSGLLSDIGSLSIAIEVINNSTSTCSGSGEECRLDNVSLRANCPVEIAGFREGVDDGFGVYSGTQDTTISGVAVNTNYCNSVLVVDEAPQARDLLIRFDDIIGLSPGQVPAGARILSATLRLRVDGAASSNSGGHHFAHLLLEPWDACAITYQNSFGGNGVDANGTEAAVSRFTSIGGLELNQVAKLSVTDAVQAWADGVPNYGFAVLPGTTDALVFKSSEAVTLTDRPRLEVVYSIESCVYGFCFCITPPASCSTADPSAGCPNSTGSGALLTAVGSTSVALDDLILGAGIPPNRMGLFFMGQGQSAPVPFGDGLLCVSPGPGLFCRFPVQNSGPSGTFVQGPGIVAYSQTLAPECRILAGQTWNFQSWYRDPTGSCGSSFNLSNGVSVVFAP
ncbi:MAG: hypothetical protein ACI8X5_003157 [Planctomycetota bacterium]